LWHAEIDEGQVSQVIHNLIVNAQQAMPAGGNIELTAENMCLSESQSLGMSLPLKAGDYVRIAVADHGSGIPAKIIDKIFDPFFSTKPKGSGLGLATSFSIARQHGGHLSVESEPGSGTTFYLYLPASTQKTITEQDAQKATKTAGKARILVMDDEKGVREIAGRMLRHIGYEDVEFAKDGTEAIKLYKAAIESGNPFGAAILDLTVPGGMGGEVAVKHLLDIDPATKAIVSSGYIDDPVMARYGEYGFSGVVAKPYTIPELRKAVHDVIG
jgi:CheY-like chemotaxis protein